MQYRWVRFSFRAVNAFDVDDALILQGTFNARGGEVENRVEALLAR